MEALGRRTWVIPDGYLAADPQERPPGLESHEAVCLLNTGPEDVAVKLMVFFEDREPLGPFAVSVGARRTLHVRTDRLRTDEGETIPRDVPYAIHLSADAPVVVQHSRMDSRAAALTLMTTIAYPADDLS